MLRIQCTLGSDDSIDKLLKALQKKGTGKPSFKHKMYIGGGAEVHSF